MDPHPSPTPKCFRTKARAGLQTEVETTTPVSFFKLYRFSTPSEVFLLCLGFTMAIIKALTLPIIVVCLGEFTAMLVDRTLQVGTSSKVYILPLFGGGKTLINATREENNAELYNDSITYGILMTITSLVMFVAGTLSVDIFNLVSLRQVTRMRKRLFQSVMRQDMGWHDLATKQNFAQNMTDDIEKIHDGISENVSHFLYLVVGFITTLFVSISYGWKLTLASSLHIPIIIILNIFVARFQRILITREQESYAGAGNLAEEVLGSIRTVVAFGGQQKELERYDRLLVPARQASQRKGAFSGLSIGIVKAMLFFSCAVAFWYGVNLILNDRHKEDKEYSPQILMIALFSTFLGADNMSRVSPILESFAMARACAAYIFKVIDSQSSIDPISTEENTPTYGLRGDIEFQDVFFRYPSRLDISVHRGLSFKVKAGQTVALVGTSGCGKSTCVQLLQRFYDPVFGAVLIDGFDIRTYNIQWLRSNIAIVGQEPVLFLASIAENISYGKPQATQKEIEAAAKSAGVHDFITSLPESYQTIVGESGSQMSGGQKQRIAIARALIQNPKILLLDEATSALDYQSEKLVQDALDAASKGRTTFVVSHRLSAIRGADKIVFIHEGKTLEEGSHDELMRLEGKYHSMVRATDIKGMEPEDERCENTNDDKREIKEVEEKSLETHFNMGKYHKNSAQLDESTLRALKERKKFIDTEPEPSNLKTCVRIIRLSRPKWLFLILGSIFAVGVGCSFPASFLAVSEIFATLTEPNGAKALRRTTLLSICCFFLGVFTGFASFSQMYLFNSAGVWLTTRVRSMVFQSMFHQEIAWFDQEENAVGALSSRLTGDAACLQGAIGQPLSGLIQGFSNFGISMILSMFYSWRLALVCLSACLFIVALVIFDLSSNVALIMREKDVIKAANCIATEAIVNIRTIAGLRREATVIERFNGEIDKAEVLIRQKLKYRGLINAGGQAIFFFFYAVGACYGGVLTSEGKMPFQDIIKVADTLLYGSIHLGYSLFFLPAFIDALVAGHRVFQIIDRKPKIALPRKIDKNSLSKEINLFEGVRFTDIEFRYPTRTDVKILDGFNLDVLQGKTVALVGHSGSGKSTCIQLLQRFYDPDSGSIHINHDDLQADLSLEALRSKLGIVSQEPSLFERTIAENIAYGDNSRDVAMGEIIEAAKNANAHSFIVSLPNGYNTRLGSRGTQLSGGQKQRIAIARALVRNPKVLLLDEATSALDLQSEQIVQKALDVACSGRTCIVIAHRLSTVQNADLICVLQNGRIEEFGNHHQLIAKDGIYAKLYKTKRDINLKRFSMTSMSINK